jgi:hypothetical protein
MRTFTIALLIGLLALAGCTNPSTPLTTYDPPQPTSWVKITTPADSDTVKIRCWYDGVNRIYHPNIGLQSSVKGKFASRPVSIILEYCSHDTGLCWFERWPEFVNDSMYIQSFCEWDWPGFPKDSVQAGVVYPTSIHVTVTLEDSTRIESPCVTYFIKPYMG